MKKSMILFGLFSVLAVAQENNINLEKSVVVSTTGFNETLLKENKNVTIISKEDLNRKEYKNVEEVLKDSPNTMIQQTYFGPIVDLRGNGERALSRVKVLVDGIAINPLDESMGTLPINTVPVSSIERIEVIPGGGAVLNGSGTAGGVVNIITKASKRKNHASVEYGAFSHATNKTSVTAGYNVTDKLYVSGGYSYVDGKGYRNGDSTQNGSGNIGIDYKITPNQSIRFNASRFEGNEDTSTPVLKSELSKNRKKAGFPVESHMTRDSYSVDYEIKPTENLTLLTTLYSQHLKRRFTENSIMDEYEMKFDKMPFGFIGRNLPVDMVGKFDEKTKGAKIRGKYKYDNGELVLGYDYATTKLRRNSVVNTSGNFTMQPPRGPMPGAPGGAVRPGAPGGTGHPGAPGHRPIGPIKADVAIDTMNDVFKRTNAVYALNKYNITEDLKLITGVRYEHSEFGGDRNNNTSVEYQAGPKKNQHSIAKSISKKNHSDDFAGEIGLNYSYRDTGSVYARYERGFISPLPGQITDKTKELNYVPNNLKSEKSDNFEIGMRDYIGNTYVSGSVFTAFTNDEITLIQGNNHNPATKYWSYENIAKTRRVGAELYLEQYLDKLTLTEAVTYVDSKITKGEYKGKKVPLAPESKITLKANYQFTDKLDAGLTFNYVGKSTVREFDKKDKAIETKKSGHHYTNLNVQYKVNDYFTVNAGVNNLFNNKYNYTETKDYAIPASTRSYYLGAKVTF